MRWLLILFVATVVFTVFTTVYAASTESSRMRVLPKWAWVLLCLLVPLVGGILYLAIGRPNSRIGVANEQLPFSAAQAPRPYGRAPEDDPAFMRELERRLREQRKDNNDQ